MERGEDPGQAWCDGCGRSHALWDSEDPKCCSWSSSTGSGGLQTVPKSQPELVKVPLAIEVAKTDEGRQLIQIGIHNVSAITRPYVLPPGTPKVACKYCAKHSPIR